MLIHDMTTLGRASLVAVFDKVLSRSLQAAVAMPSLVCPEGWVAETFPPTSVGSTVNTYLILHGQCGCPESAGNAVAWTDPKSSCIYASRVRYGRKVARLCATAERSLTTWLKLPEHLGGTSASKNRARVCLSTGVASCVHFPTSGASAVRELEPRA